MSLSVYECFALPTLCSLVAALQCYWIAGGQHGYEAVRQCREEKGLRREPVPRWCEYFAATVLKPGLSLHEMQTIAGRLQAQATNVRAFSPVQTMQLLLDLAEARRREQPLRPLTRSELLADVYAKSGKNSITDGTVV